MPSIRSLRAALPQSEPRGHALHAQRCPLCGGPRRLATPCNCSQDAAVLAPAAGTAEGDLGPRRAVANEVEAMGGDLGFARSVSAQTAPVGSAARGTLDPLKFVDEVREHMQDGPPVTLEPSPGAPPHHSPAIAPGALRIPETPTARDPWPAWLGLHVERRGAAIAVAIAAFGLGLALGQGQWRPGALLAVVAAAMVLWGRTPAFAAGGLAAVALFAPASANWSANFALVILLALVIVCAPGSTLLGWLAPALGCIIAAAAAALVVGPRWSSEPVIAFGIWATITVAALGLSHWLTRFEKYHHAHPHAVAHL